MIFNSDSQVSNKRQSALLLNRFLQRRPSVAKLQQQIPTLFAPGMVLVVGCVAVMYFWLTAL